jgi:hypothetical protein
MAPLNLSGFCGDLQGSALWRFCRSRKGVTVPVDQNSLTHVQSRQSGAGMAVAKAAAATFRKGTRFMKTLVSLALGAAMLFSAATLGLHSGSASARTRHDRNWYAHHHHHHSHHHHRHNKLSY